MCRIELKEQNPQPVLSIRLKTTIEDLSQVIGKSYMKIIEYLKEIGEEPTDVPFTAYYNLDMDNLDVEIGFPVSKHLSNKGEIKYREIPQTMIISKVHKGSYSKMEEPYNEMFKWIEENEYEQVGIYYEYYYNSPEEVSEEELLTKIVMPIKVKE